MGLEVGTNSYVTIEYADDFFNARYGDEENRWTNLTEYQKEIVLIQAAQLIDALPFKGIKNSLDQPMAFPRSLVSKHNVEFVKSSVKNIVNPNTIDVGYPQDPYYRVEGLTVYLDVGTPEAVRIAQCEEAAYLLEVQSSSGFKSALSGITSVTVGPVRETYDVGKVFQANTYVAPIVKTLLRPYLAGSVDQI